MLNSNIDVTNFRVLPDLQGPDLIKEGERLFSEGKVDEARHMFEQAAESCPGNAAAWNNLAVMAINDNNPQEAELLLKQALEVKADFLEARCNLVEVYSAYGQYNKAIRELLKILEQRPGDIPATKRLAQLYINTDKPEKARELIENSRGVGAMKNFINTLWMAIKYCDMADNLNSRDKLEKLTANLLDFFDGQNGRGRRWRLVSQDEETGEEIILEDFLDSFYYNETRSPNLEAQDARREMVLTVGKHDDWIFFHNALNKEMKAEGGCLGDFTQTKKVLRNEPRLAHYDIAATLRYFEHNVGPCDCHVLRGALV